MHDLLSITNLNSGEITKILDRAEEFEKNGIPVLYKDESAVVATLFFEASTRTRLSFEAAAARLGARVIGFADPASTSLAQKGESLEDTLRMIDSYADVIVMRHPDAASAGTAAELCEHPVVNAGNGADEHPTQVLIDLYTMRKRFGSLYGLRVAMVGDLKYGRVPHSLARALAMMDAGKQIWVCPEKMAMPQEVAAFVHESGAEVYVTQDLQTALAEVDVVYMTRVQAERFDNPEEYEKLKDAYILAPEMLNGVSEKVAIMHALPRRYELPESIDALPQAAYFEQAANAVVVRAAILEQALQETRK